jgi:hypothetical protein
VARSTVVRISLPEKLARAARRQSMLVRGRASERDALRFVEALADLQGWC